VIVQKVESVNVVVGVNDVIEFENRGNSDDSKLMMKVKIIKIYKSFRDAIIDCGVERLLPHIGNVEEAIRIYESFNGGRYKVDGEKFGVVCFVLEKV
jgi:ASC-1-like (ASCH) protein